jgi:hypothetical protein
MHRRQSRRVSYRVDADPVGGYKRVSANIKGICAAPSKVLVKVRGVPSPGF